MRPGKAILCVVLPVLSLPGYAQNLASPDAYLACSVEMLARAWYVDGAALSDSGHVQFLIGRADLLVAMAEFAHAREIGDCLTPDRIWRGATPCDPDESIRLQRDRLAMIRKNEIVAETGGTARLPV